MFFHQRWTVVKQLLLLFLNNSFSNHIIVAENTRKCTLSTDFHLHLPRVHLERSSLHPLIVAFRKQLDHTKRL